MPAWCRDQTGVDSIGRMFQELDVIIDELMAHLSDATAADDVEQLRHRYLGRKGKLAAAISAVRIETLPDDQRREAGVRIKQARERAEAVLQERAVADTGPGRVELDATLPGSDHRLGSLHPVSLARQAIEDVLRSMGFLVMDGPEVVSEYLNFDSLNIPPDHPARDMHDTFWLENGMVLRTHTSSNQVPALKRFGAPLRAAFVGRCFRYEDIDASHENTFDQVEGLMVDRDVSIANLIAVMKAMLDSVFERDVTVRLRPGYFPFVEPGFELDIRCTICDGVGCRTCKGTGWIELLPCGMVHPFVLREGGVDPTEHRGFAFGLGLTRLAMMKYGIEDIRVLNAGDLRTLGQFPVEV
jgi:phenylalanyl-tRNA synthetase alpha chain